MNAQFVYDLMVGNRVNIKQFELLEFKEGQKPELKEIMAASMNKMVPMTPSSKAPVQSKPAPAAKANDIDDMKLKKQAADEPAGKRAWDDEEQKKAPVDEEAKKKARAEMRKKLMLPDNVTSKLKGINTGKNLQKKPSTVANGGDISIRDIKKPEEEKKPIIKVENVDGKNDKPKIQSRFAALRELDSDGDEPGAKKPEKKEPEKKDPPARMKIEPLPPLPLPKKKDTETKEPPKQSNRFAALRELDSSGELPGEKKPKLQSVNI